MLRAYAVSIAIHATLIVALYVIPVTSMRRFSRAGQNQVISIELVERMPAYDSTLVSLSDADTTVDSLREKPRDLFQPALEFSRESVSEMAQVDSTPEVAPDVALPVRSVSIDRVRRYQIAVDRPQVENHSVVERPVDKLTPPKPTVLATTPAQQVVGVPQDTAADFSQNLPPTYPPEAVRKRLEGVVMLELSIATSGEVRRVELLRSSGHRILDEAAMNAVGLWKGAPATRFGRAVESVERLPIRFRL